MPALSSSSLSQIQLQSYMHFDLTAEDDMNFENELLERGDPALFIYEWNTPVLIIGNGQSLEEVNANVCALENIPIIRRRSGGTGVLHNHTLNVGLVLPSSHPWTNNVSDLYKRLLTPVGEALMSQNISVQYGPADSPLRKGRTPICFETHGDDSLLINGKKVFGCAQRRAKSAILVHGTLFLDMDISQQGRVFNVSLEHIDKIMATVPEGVEPGILANTIKDALYKSLNVDNRTLDRATAGLM